MFADSKNYLVAIEASKQKQYQNDHNDPIKGRRFYYAFLLVVLFQLLL